MIMHARRIVTGTALLAAIALGGCVKVRTLDEPSLAEAVPAADDASVTIYAATNPFELAETRSTSSQLLNEAETVGHLVVTRSIVGLALRADDKHIIDVAKKRARRMGGDSIVVLSWDAVDVRKVDVAALPVPLPEDGPSYADRMAALALAASAEPVAAASIMVSGAFAYAVVESADEVWFWGRPPVSMTARVLRCAPAESR